MSSWRAGILASKWMAAAVYSKIIFTVPYLILDPLYSQCKELLFKIFPLRLYHGPKLLSDLADSNHAWRFLHLFTDEKEGKWKKIYQFPYWNMGARQTELNFQAVVHNPVPDSGDKKMQETLPEAAKKYLNHMQNFIQASVTRGGFIFLSLNICSFQSFSVWFLTV